MLMLPLCNTSCVVLVQSLTKSSEQRWLAARYKLPGEKAVRHLACATSCYATDPSVRCHSHHAGMNLLTRTHLDGST